MDLAVGARQVFLALEHTTREGAPRLLKRCNLPVTATGVVTKVVTNLGLFDVTPDGFVLREIAPGYSPEGGAGRHGGNADRRAGPEGASGLEERRERKS